MRAEAQNEYAGPGELVWNDVNLIRKRAGLPDVETSWTDTRFARPQYLNKHTTKEGMRDIILQERSIELAFEGGSRFWDMVRYKRATIEFNSPVYGWSERSTTGSAFFKLEIEQERKFSVKDCLWPLTLDELNKNKNLTQNPGW
jgi:hypothetical protein